MGRSSPFCPRCGDDLEEGTGRHDPATPDSDATLCPSCYRERLEVLDLPERLEIEVCPHCGAIRRGKEWTDVGAIDYADVALEAVGDVLAVHVDVEDVRWGADPEVVHDNEVRVHTTVHGRVGEEEITVDRTVVVTFARSTCTRCGRIAGDYYASVVQVRADDRTPTDEERDRAGTIAHETVSAMEATGDREAFITEVGETADGLDIRVSTTSIGRQIATKLVEEFGGTVSDSETLVTEDEDGNPVYRVTYAVRLPAFTPGDVIDLTDDDGGPVLVRSVHGNLKGVRVTTGEPYEASYEEGDTPDARRLGDRSDATETTVVTVEDDHAVQVLDPETTRATTVARPSYMDESAETVPVLKSRAGLHVLPAEGE